MEIVARKQMVTTQRIALLSIADDATGQHIAREVSRIARNESMIPVIATRDFKELRELSTRFQPAAVLLDEALAGGADLTELLRRLVTLAPVVLIAAVERQAEIASVVAA